SQVQDSSLLRRDSTSLKRLRETTRSWTSGPPPPGNREYTLRQRSRKTPWLSTENRNPSSRQGFRYSGVGSVRQSAMFALRPLPSANFRGLLLPLQTWFVAVYPARSPHSAPRLIHR